MPTLHSAHVLSVPEEDLVTFALARARAHPARLAVVDASASGGCTYEALAENVERVAAGLADLGVGRGGVVAICLPNVPEFVPAFLGVARAGATSTTINPTYTGYEVSRQLKNSGASVLITAAGAAEQLQALDEPAPTLVLVGEGGRGGIGFDRLLEAGGDPPARAIDPAQDIVTMPYSSGTTGMPKGVMLTHRNLVANALQCRPFFVSEEDVVLAVTPFFHIMGMVGSMLAGLCRGATLVTMPRFDAEGCLSAIERHRVTSTIVAPPAAVALSRHPRVEGSDLSSLRRVTTGGAPLGAKLQETCAARLDCRVGQAWGMTEIAGAGLASPPNSDPPDPAGSVGSCVPGGELRVVDPATGSDVDTGRPGELWYRGPNVMKGYLHDADATAAMLVDGGWCRTGDLAKVDRAGFVWIVDRLKELIKYKGFQIAPAELEAVLASHPLVVDAAVTPVPDEEVGELPKAHLVLAEGTDPRAVDTEILPFLAHRVASYKRVRDYELVHAIPRTPSGKIVRRELKG